MNYGRYWLTIYGRCGEEKKIPFKVNGIDAEKVSLEQIDYVLSQMKDISDFYGCIKHMNIEIPFAPLNIAIVYRANGEDKKLDPIFHNEAIMRTSAEVINKRRDKRIAKDQEKAKKKENPSYKEEKEYDLSISYDNKYIQETVKTIKNLVLTPETQKLSLREFPYYVREEMKSYLEMIKQNPDTRNYETNKITKELISYLKNYTNFREMQIVFKKINTKLAKRQKKIEDFKQMNLFDYIENVPQVEQSQEIDPDMDEGLKALASEYQMREDVAVNPEASRNYVEDPVAKEAYDAYGDDPYTIVEYLGYDKASSLSEHDKYVIGITDDLLNTIHRR